MNIISRINQFIDRMKGFSSLNLKGKPIIYAFLLRVRIKNLNLHLKFLTFFYRCTVHFEFYAVHSQTNSLFINLVKSFKFTLKYTIISVVHVSVFSDHHQGALSVPN